MRKLRPINDALNSFYDFFSKFVSVCRILSKSCNLICSGSGWFYDLAN